MLKRYDNYFCRVSGIYYLTFRLQAMLLSWIHDIWLFVHRYMTFDFLFTCTWHLTFCLQVHDIGLFVYRFMTSDCLFTGTWYLTVCLQVHDICLFVYRYIYLTVCLQVHNTLLFVYRYLTSDFLFTGTLHLTFCLQAHNIWLFVLYTEIWYLTALMEYNWCPSMSGTIGGGSVSALAVSLVSCLLFNTLNVREKQDVEMISFIFTSFLLMYIDLIDS